MKSEIMKALIILICSMQFACSTSDLELTPVRRSSFVVEHPICSSPSNLIGRCEAINTLELSIDAPQSVKEQLITKSESSLFNYFDHARKQVDIVRSEKGASDTACEHCILFHVSLSEGQQTGYPNSIELRINGWDANAFLLLTADIGERNDLTRIDSCIDAAVNKHLLFLFEIAGFDKKECIELKIKN